LPVIRYRGSLNGAREYRAVQGASRNGEVEPALTGKGIEDESRELRSELRKLESAIIHSQGAEQELGTIELFKN
jgi:hypothetical protein